MRTHSPTTVVTLSYQQHMRHHPHRSLNHPRMSKHIFDHMRRSGGEESLSDGDEAHRFNGNPETKNLMKTKRIRDSKLSSKESPLRTLQSFQISTIREKMPSHAYVNSGRRVESKPHSKPSGSGFTAENFPRTNESASVSYEFLEQVQIYFKHRILQLIRYIMQCLQNFDS